MTSVSRRMHVSSFEEACVLATLIILLLLIKKQAERELGLPGVMPLVSKVAELGLEPRSV